ncbi:sporulation protein [Amylibacter ulvae]|uniref:Sporulation protein n=1 Tax=Paramylibacter ulvae TaxID=1651968 RepID=A0ABQ3D2S0_9RHOB|nr:SPOR domain-containing protein [Amylibacter ulvae]GHA55393.1 sporulation protein [Amylibacter ulvae]
MTRKFIGALPTKIACSFLLFAGLSACEEGKTPNFLKAKDKPTGTAGTDAASPGFLGKTVEKDVEAPEVFEKTAKGLWDGRPSLGGVWVAHPDNKKPERVIIKNNANGKFVIGALFRRERDNPGPEFQLSSDAAEAIGALAGGPVELTVTAMRTKKVPVAGPADEMASDVTAAGEPETVAATSLDASPAAQSGANDDTMVSMVKPLPRPTDVKPVAAKPAAAKPAAAPAPKASANARYVQMGFFSVQANADATLAQLKSNGISGKIVASSAKGKSFWRVLAGPADTGSSQKTLLSKVKAMGFNDAYLVKG